MPSAAKTHLQMTKYMGNQNFPKNEIQTSAQDQSPYPSTQRNHKYLQSICNRSKPCECYRKLISFRCRKSLVGYKGKIVCEYDFFREPIRNRLTPSEKSSNVTVLSFICASIVLYLTIGPAISCGKNDM